MSKIVKRPSKFYSPLRYPGGKASLTNFLSNLIDINNLGGGTYIEPYAGGAGSALSLLILEKVDQIIINDFDKAIFSFWNLLINNPEYLIEKIEKVDVSIKEWIKQKEIYQSPNSSANDLGFATFYLNRTNHSGIIEGRPIGGFKQKSKWKIGARFKKSSLIKRVRKIATYRSRIQVRNEDGIELMNSYECDLDRKIFYIDPPYYVKGSSLYLNHYSKQDHERLANFLNKNNSLNWVLTYDKVEEISELYKTRKKFSFSINYSVNEHKEGNELMIYSDSISIPDY